MHPSYFQYVQYFLSRKTNGKNKFSALISLLRLVKFHVNFPFPQRRDTNVWKPLHGLVTHLPMFSGVQILLIVTISLLDTKYCFSPRETLLFLALEIFFDQLFPSQEK